MDTELTQIVESTETPDAEATTGKIVKGYGNDRAEFYALQLGYDIKPSERYNGESMEYLKGYKANVLKGRDQYYARSG